ncbi:MAG: T9SS type A sorting domain-containing protein [Ignavibacteriaceae bacterium]|nr:T9SS type A sorting domain-containing protein [Ignavibacteriaceae bacterium]
MKKFLATILLLVLGLSISASAQNASKTNLNRTNSNNSPVFVYGPWTESDNQVNESFEGASFPPAGWLKFNVQGSDGWTTINVGTTPIPGWTGGSATPATADAGTKMAYTTYDNVATNNDHWLASPQVLNVQPGDSIMFWLRKYSSAYSDNMDIKISTTVQNNAAAYTTTVAALVFPVGPDTGWRMLKYAIPNSVPAGSNIYVGFRSWVIDNINNGGAFFLDLVKIGGVVVPVEFATFYSSVNQNNVTLHWSTATETNNLGFEVERKAANGSFVKVGFVSGKGTTTNTSSYSYQDKNVQPGTYSYRLRQIDLDGTSEYSNVIETEVLRPNEYALNQNYPNPFNPSTKLSFSLAVDAKVTVKIFNVLGQEISTLINGNLTAGSHNVNFNAAGLQSGVYFAKMEAKGIDGSSFSDIKKMILNK